MAGIIQTICLVIGPLGGIFLGSWLTRAKDERQWRRDRCLEAYVDVLRACNIVIIESGKLWLYHDLAEPEVQRIIVHEKLMDLDNAAHRSALLCPESMRISCKEVSECFGRIVMTAGATPKAPRTEWTKTTAAADVATQFMTAARNDLYTPSLAHRWADRRTAVTVRVTSWVQSLRGRLGMGAPSS